MYRYAAGFGIAACYNTALMGFLGRETYFRITGLMWEYRVSPWVWVAVGVLLVGLSIAREKSKI